MRALSRAKASVDLEIKMRNSVSAALLGLLLMGGSVAAAEAASEQFLTSLPSDALPINENYYNQSVYDVKTMTLATSMTSFSTKKAR